MLDNTVETPALTATSMIVLEQHKDGKWTIMQARMEGTVRVEEFWQYLSAQDMLAALSAVLVEGGK